MEFLPPLERQGARAAVIELWTDFKYPRFQVDRVQFEQSRDRKGAEAAEVKRIPRFLTGAALMKRRRVFRLSHYMSRRLVPKNHILAKSTYRNKPGARGGTAKGDPSSPIG